MGCAIADAVGRLERRGVIQFVADGSNTVARLVHPLMGETAMQRAGVVRSRQINGMLAQHFRKHMRAEESGPGRPTCAPRCGWPSS